MASPQKKPVDLVIFDTHPIQYRSPVFRKLAQRLNSLEVVFFAEAFDGNRWWFHEVNKIPKQTWGLSLGEGFSHRTVGAGSLLNLFRTAARWLNEWKPRAILIYGYYLPEHWIIWCLAAYHRVPILFVGENFEPAKTGNPLKRALKKMLRSVFLSRVEAYISIGKRNLDYYRSIGIPETKLFPALYCIDNEFFSAELANRSTIRESLRKRLSIPENSVCLLFVGRIYDRKRPMDLIRLHCAIKSDAVHTIVVGNGELEEEMRAAQKKLPRFHYVGFKNQKEIREFYLASDILVVPSEFETWGLVVNEAFVAGMTAAVTDGCGTAHDLVRPEETGFVFPVGEVERVAKWVDGLAVDRPRLASLQSKAKSRVAEYSPDLFAQRIIEAIDSVDGSGNSIPDASSIRAVGR